MKGIMKGFSKVLYNTGLSKSASVQEDAPVRDVQIEKVSKVVQMKSNDDANKPVDLKEDEVRSVNSHDVEIKSKNSKQADESDGEEHYAEIQIQDIDEIKVKKSESKIDEPPFLNPDQLDVEYMKHVISQKPRSISFILQSKSQSIHQYGSNQPKTKDINELKLDMINLDQK